MKTRAKLWLLGLTLGLLVPSTSAFAVKTVSLTFDDGLSYDPAVDTYLTTYGMKGTFFIISGSLDGSDPYYMTAAQALTIQSHGHEIGGHTITHPGSPHDLTTMTPSQQQHEICDGRAQLIADGFSPVVSFAYPEGAGNATTEAIVKGCGFTSGRGAWCDNPLSNNACNETVPPIDPYKVQTPSAIGSVSNITSLTALENIVTYANSNDWIVYQFHFVCPDADATCNADTYSVKASTFTAFLSWLQGQASSGTVVVEPMGQVMTPGWPLTTPIPAITSISPSTVTVLGSTFTMTVNGVNFVNGSVVYWNTSALATTFVNATQLTALVPASDLATLQVTTITVTNPAPNAATSPGTLCALVNPVPTLTVLSSTYTIAGSTGITLGVTGSNFVATSSIQWNGSSRVTTYISSTSLSAVIPATDLVAAKISSVTVMNVATGTSGSSNILPFTILNQVPVLNSISPSSVTVGALTTTLTLSGTNFVNTSIVRWNGAIISSTTYVNATALRMQIPASTMTVVSVDSVTVVNAAPGGGTSSTQTFTVGNPPPVLTSLSSTSTIAGNAQITLTLRGSNFVASSVAQWNGSNRTTTYVSASTLTVVIPATDLAAAMVSTVTVVNPPPGGSTSAGLNFTINNPVPALTALSSTSTIAGNSGLTLTLTGSNFNASSVVNWNGSARATTYTNSTSISATIPASDLALASVDSVSVFNPAPAGGTSSALTFTVLNPVPSVTSLSPSLVVVNSVGATVTVTGTNFVNTSVVNWNGSARPTTYNSATSLTVTLPGTDLTVVSTFPVTVTNPVPGGGTSGSQIFTVGWPVPVLSSLSPVAVTVNSPDFTLTVTGSKFVPTSVIGWNGFALVPTTYVNSTTLSATVPAANVVSTGPYTITVYTAPLGGGLSGTQTFMVGNPIPVLTSLSTNLVVFGSTGFGLTVTGANFVPGAVVRWNGSDRATTYTNSTTLTAQITTADLSALIVSTITVFNPAPAGGTSSGMAFTVGYPVPVMTSISPVSPIVGTIVNTLTVNGSNFVPNVSLVQVNGSPRTTAYISGNTTTLTATLLNTDYNSVGISSITVFTPGLGGGTSGVQLFTVGNPIPVLTPTSLSPSFAVEGGSPFILTITGLNFVDSSVVQWSGQSNLTPIPPVTPTSIQVSVPASYIAVAGNPTITVFNPAPGGGSSLGVALPIKSGSGGIASISAPTLAMVSPTSVLAGSPAFTMTITGTNFASDSTILWNGAPLGTAPTIVSSNLLTVVIPAGDVSSPGSATVAVSNPGPNGGTSASQSIAIGSNQVRVHPNPWRANVHAGQMITFDELPADSTIKIFTASAHWVRTLSAPAGSATWDLKNDSGDNVASGYYIYLVTNPQGKSRGTLAIIR